MINLTIKALDGHLYEITGRYNPSQSSSAQLIQHDPYLTQRLIARLLVDTHTWLQVLAQVDLRSAEIHSHHPGSLILC